MTVPWGIEYPCLGPVIDPQDFQDHATTTEAALSLLNGQTPALLRPDFVKAQGVNPNTAVNVTSTVSWTTPPAANNPNGMFNAGSPTLFTVITAGSYWAYLHVSNFTFPTTETSIRGAVLVNGTERVWQKIGGPTSTANSFLVSGLLKSLTVGQQITSTFLWTGTGGPITPLFDIAICKISDL